MTRKIIFTQRAESDLNSIVDYIAADSPENAVEFYLELEKDVISLADFPESGFVPRNYAIKNRKCRCLVCVNYVAIYYYDKPNETVQIRRILHGAMLHGTIDD